MKRANKFAAKHTLIVGEKELEQGSVILRNMATKDQVLLPIENLVENVKAKLAV
jgi:histidyl-tRNA synthetase